MIQSKVMIPLEALNTEDPYEIVDANVCYINRLLIKLILFIIQILTKNKHRYFMHISNKEEDIKPVNWCGFEIRILNMDEIHEAVKILWKVYCDE